MRFTFPEFSAYITIVFLATVFGLWLWSEMARRRKSRRERKFLFRCDLCGLVFPDLEMEKLSKCPHCGRMNERQPFVEI